MESEITASVSETSNPAPFIASYAIQVRGEPMCDGYYAERKNAERDLEEDYAPGTARIVTIPGDDAPPATANELANKGSEPPDGPQSDRIVPVMCRGVRTNGWYVNDQYGWRAYWSKMDCEHNAPVTSWDELPEKPK